MKNHPIVDLQYKNGRYQAKNTDKKRQEQRPAYNAAS
jgi:hypothetical protein